jgi:hypothetical protein
MGFPRAVPVTGSRRIEGRHINPRSLARGGGFEGDWKSLDTRNRPQKPFQCKTCRKKFKTEKQLKLHRLAGFDCHILSPSISPAPRDSSMQKKLVHPRELLKSQCSRCGRKFRTPAALQTHECAAQRIQRSAPAGLKRCSVCGVPVKRSRLANHLRSVHHRNT